MVYENSTKKSHFRPNHFQTIFGWFWYTMKLFIHTRAGNRIFCQNLNWNVRMVLQCDHLLKVSEKVTQKLVLSASKSKAQYSDTNISVDNVPHCVRVFRFAYLTKFALLSLRKEKKIFLFIGVENHQKCLIHGKKYWIEIYKIQATQICIRWLTLISDFHPKNLDFDS